MTRPLRPECRMGDPSDRQAHGSTIEEVPIEGPCPYCGAEGLVMRSLPLNIPYFGDALQTTVLCTSCTFRHPDLLLMNQGPPIRFELHVESPSELTARVARSSACTVRVPEIQATIEPGLRAEAFVTNAEGVLRRIRDVTAFLVRNADGSAAKRTAERTMRTLDEMIAGRQRFTIVLEDPTGNSAIVHDRATKTILTDREARELKRAVPEFRVAR